MLNFGLKVCLDAFGIAERRLSIVTFHRVLDRHDPLRGGEPDCERFRDELAWLKSTCRILPLADAVQALREGRLPRRALSITFDDGYLDNWRNALPILQELEVPATFFIATAFLDGSAMWNDRVIEVVRQWQAGPLDLQSLGLGCYRPDEDRGAALRALLGDLKYRPTAERSTLVDQICATAQITPAVMMMSPGEVRALFDAGMGIGGHTHNHPILNSLTPAEVTAEVVENKRILEDIIGEPLQLFAYPNGRPGVDFDHGHVAILRQAGYRAAVTTAQGTASRRTDPFQLPRFKPWDRDRTPYLARLTLNYFRNPPLLAPAPQP